MISSLNKKNGMKLAIDFILVQIAISAIVAVLAFMVFGGKMAVSAFVGCAINIIASGYFAVVSLKLPKNASPGMILARFYIGEVGKFVIVAVCFGGVFKYLPELIQGRHAIILFAAFLIAQLAYVVAPLLLEEDFN